MGDYEVYESGSVTSVKGEPIEFVFSGFSVKIFFEFVEHISKKNVLLDIIKNFWSIITPLITTAVGYLFRKTERD